MSQVIVGRWGRSLAIRIPLEVGRACGLGDGERVELEIHNGDILVRRSEARTNLRADAQAAATEIMAGRKKYSLGETSIAELLAEGRRG